MKLTLPAWKLSNVFIFYLMFITLMYNVDHTYNYLFVVILYLVYFI